MARGSEGFEASFDSEKFEKLLLDLSRNITAANMKDIVRNEAARIVFRSLGKTKKGDKKKILSDFGAFEQKYDPERAKNPGQRARMEKWVARRKLVTEEKIRRIGLSKQAWLDIANDLGFQPRKREGTGMSFARKATVNGARRRHASKGAQRVSRGNYQIVILYGNPVGKWAGAQKALSSSVAGRSGYFRRNLREGVFDATADIAKKYPGINISRG